MKTLFLVAALFCSSALRAEERPRPDASNCEFYKTLEKKLNCKARGVDYLSEYAPYYCEKFKNKSAEWSGEASAWANETSLCLQQKLYASLKDASFSCKNLEETAYGTHADCYNKAKLCQLKISDLIRILRVIKVKDLVTELRYSAGEIDNIVMSCLDTWFNNSKN